MNILSWADFLKGFGDTRSLAATIGVFDGLHIGHQRLIELVTKSFPGSRKAAFTFTDNPKRITRSHSFHGNLMSLEQKLEGFEALGLDTAVLIDFSGNFSKLTGKDFLSLLCDRGRLAYLAVGRDFRCGHGLDTGVDELKTFLEASKVEVSVVDAVEYVGKAVSSSRVRQALKDGRLEEVSAMLGRPYEIDLRRCAVDGACGYLLPESIVLPPEGFYLASLAGVSGDVQVKVEGGILRLEDIDLTGSPCGVSLIRVYKEMKR